MTFPRRWIVVSWITLLGLVIVILSAGVVRWQYGTGGASTSTYTGTPLNGIAPDFQLLNQHNAQVSLLDFRGNVVALVFMDSTCVDVCPLISLQLQAVYQHLIATAEGGVPVVFVGVNVNAKNNTPKDVLEFSIKNGLHSIPTWNFLTGSPQQLQEVWEAYNITVAPSEEDSSISHTPGVYLINQKGEKAWYVAVPVRLESTWQGSSLSELLEMRIKELLGSK